MRIPWRIGILLWTLGISALTQITAAQEIPADYQQVLKIVGKSGDYKSNVLKVNIPRNDLHMKVAGVALPTPFGFGGWFAMTKGEGGHDVLMGDLVLTQEEVNPVMSALLDHGLEVTALHNHFFWDEPRVFYMHVHGHGQAADLANKIKPALDLIGHGAPAPAASAGSAAPKSTLDSAKIAKIVGHDGEQTGAVYKITIGRDDLSVKEMGATINARMGLNTWAAFAGTDEDAAVAGDVAMKPPWMSWGRAALNSRARSERKAARAEQRKSFHVQDEVALVPFLDCYRLRFIGAVKPRLAGGEESNGSAGAAPISPRKPGRQCAEARWHA